MNKATLLDLLTMFFPEYAPASLACQVSESKPHRFGLSPSWRTGCRPGNAMGGDVCWPG